MSKVVASLPGGFVRNGVVGAILALTCYVVFQFLWSFLIHCEIVGEGMVYLLVCVSAGLSAFLGCGYSAVRGGSGSVLSASAVVVVFLTLTVAVALLTGEVDSIGAGLTGIGGAMAAGGLAAALLAGMVAGKGKSGRDKMKKRRIGK